MDTTRPTAVAGSFYPQDPGVLRATVDELLRIAAVTVPEGEAPPKALIVTWPNMTLPGDSNLYLVDLEKPGIARCITQHEGAAQWPLPATAQRGPIAQFVDERVILALSDEKREFIGLQRIDLDSGGREYLFDPAWDVETMAISRSFSPRSR